MKSINIEGLVSFIVKLEETLLKWHFDTANAISSGTLIKWQSAYSNLLSTMGKYKTTIDNSYSYWNCT